MTEENISQEITLRKIDETGSYFLDEIKQRMHKKFKETGGSRYTIKTNQAKPAFITIWFIQILKIYLEKQLLIKLKICSSQRNKN